MEAGTGVNRGRREPGRGGNADGWVRLERRADERRGEDLGGGEGVRLARVFIRRYKSSVTQRR